MCNALLHASGASTVKEKKNVASGAKKGFKHLKLENIFNVRWRKNNAISSKSANVRSIVKISDSKKIKKCIHSATEYAFKMWKSCSGQAKNTFKVQKLQLLSIECEHSNKFWIFLHFEGSFFLNSETLASTTDPSREFNVLIVGPSFRKNPNLT